MQIQPCRAYLLLGSNLGEREQILDRTITLIGDRLGVVKALSSLHETEPWGFESSDLFLNQAVLLETTLSPQVLLEGVLAIETALGRTRQAGTGYTSRSIDIDLLLLDDQIIETDDLIVPHPRLAERVFALAPLAEIASEVIHPQLGQSVAELLHLQLQKETPVADGTV